MQSSSQLFPVGLIRAELYGNLTEDVYLLKPNNSPDPSVELALTRLGRLNAPSSFGQSVVLLHGAFDNRYAWYTPRGEGLALTLVEAGFDVWIAEMRGHGLSPRNLDYVHNRLADYARYDLPAIAAFVEEQTGWPSHWIGQAMGGLSVLHGMVDGHLKQHTSVASLVMWGTTLERQWRPLSWIERRRSILSGHRTQRGAEDEPVGLLVDVERGSRALRLRKETISIMPGLERITVPLLSMAAHHDPLVPVEQCQALFDACGAPRKIFQTVDVSSAKLAPTVPLLSQREAHTHLSHLVLDWLNSFATPVGSTSLHSYGALVASG
ncbi:alpha-beta hydrolase superfamily lysophospholipase [Pseudomonas duriflava]|uniref:Alpha-beta hydrolase superfamily lysophospholipase n=1 Tax=Pseudomonas duriflava TaxID=459528 RepID=A0A562QBB5_9PSED|nr:alpha/beta fold hydrolase [Pseudomonas duriflava]TWI53480.1 alpha-beta hydrolase superfamily lysophospholipase [Pseudomonas duriflava]